MKTQVIENSNGTAAGVFIPQEDWNNLKRQFPNLEKVNAKIPKWQKELLDERLKSMKKKDQLKPIDSLFDLLDK